MVWYFSQHYRGATSNSSVHGWSVGITPQRLEKDVLIFQSALWSWNIKLISNRIVSRHPAPSSSGVSPYMVIKWLSPNIFVNFLSPVVNYSASSKMVYFFSRLYGGETSNSSVLGWLVGITPKVYQGFPLIWLFNYCLHTFICQLYRPLWIIPPPVRWFDFSFVTLEVKHQTHWYLDG